MAMEVAVVSTSVPGRLPVSLAGEWRRAGPAQRFACLAGCAFMPATFGLSFGLTTITLAWVTGRLRVTGHTR